MIDQHTDKQVGDRVISRVDIREFPAGSKGTVRKGFAGLLTVHFDRQQKGMDMIMATVNGEKEYVVNLCDPLPNEENAL